MYCIHIQPCSDEWEAVLVIFVKTENLAMLQTHKLHSYIFEKMILLCKMLIINCQTCFNLGGTVNTAVPPVKTLQGTVPLCPPHDLRHWCCCCGNNNVQFSSVQLYLCSWGALNG